MLGKLRKIVLGVTGASGSIYAYRLFEKLKRSNIPCEDIAVVFSEQGRSVFEYELTGKSISNISFTMYENNDFTAPFASGSSSFDTMIIAPCSMGTMASVANGLAHNLICRAADVMLKERRRLILVTRETPLSLVHLRNMTTITEAGGVICPASPSFYSRPNDIDALVDTVVERVLCLAGIVAAPSFSWGESKAKIESIE